MEHDADLAHVHNGVDLRISAFGEKPVEAARQDCGCATPSKGQPPCPRLWKSSNSDDLGFDGIGDRLPALITGPSRQTIALRQRKAEAVAER